MRSLRKRCTMYFMKCAQLQKRCHRKMEKKNCQLGIFGLISLINSFASYAHGRRICLLETVIFLKLRKNNNNNKFLSGNETAANEPTLKMWLINSYLGFIFVFHFSKSRQRYCNLVCTKRKRERKKERKTGEIPKDRICSDQYISDILLIWKPGF